MIWNIKKLNEIATFIRNGANIKQNSEAKGFPIIKIETISNDKLNDDKLGFANNFDDKLFKKKTIS